MVCFQTIVSKTAKRFRLWLRQIRESACIFFEFLNILLLRRFPFLKTIRKRRKPDSISLISYFYFYFYFLLLFLIAAFLHFVRRTFFAACFPLNSPAALLFLLI